MADEASLDLDSLQSRIKELAEIRSNCYDDADLVTSDEDALLRECVFQLEGKMNEVIEEYSDVSSLPAEDFENKGSHSHVHSIMMAFDDTYLENLKGELSAVEAENAKLSGEVGNLMKGYLEDSIRLQSHIEGLTSSLEFIQSQGLVTKSTDARLECSSLPEHQLESKSVDGGCKFKMLELNSQIEKKEGILKFLEDLDYTLKRCEDVLKTEDTLTGLEVIGYEGNRISLSLRTHIPEIEIPEQNHELAIELLDGTLELKNAEIFPNDVYIGEIIDSAKSFTRQFSLLPIPENKSSLEWFVRKVQDRIVLSTMRKFLVKDASKSRHSIEYVDRDEMVVAHMVDGIDAFIKVSQGWPMASSALKLQSLKGSSQSSKEVTFSFLCKVEGMVNSLDGQVCQNLSTFIDAIEEILKQRIRAEVQSSK